jgi:hypothetical protein
MNYSQLHIYIYIQDLQDEAGNLLIDIFQACVDIAHAECLKLHGESDRISFTIYSRTLFDHGEMYVPYNQITDKTVEALLVQFMAKVHSKLQEGVTTWDSTFNIRVGILDKTLDKLPPIVRAPRKQPPIHHIIKEKQLLKVS